MAARLVVSAFALPVLARVRRLNHLAVLVASAVMHARVETRARAAASSPAYTKVYAKD